MRESFSLLFVVFLNVTSLLLNAVGSMFGMAGSGVHVLFLRKATRHDLKYGLTDSERTAVLTANESNKATQTQSKKTSGLQVN